MHALSQHLRIPLRLHDIRVPEHTTDILNLCPIPEHISCKGMPRQMRVQPRLNPRHLPQGFQLMIIIRIIHLRNGIPVLLQHRNRRRQQHRDIRNPRLNTFAHMPPCLTVPLIVPDIEFLVCPKFGWRQVVECRLVQR